MLVPGRGGHAAGDILIGVEGVIGSAGDDDLDAADNESIDGLQGGGGNDTLRGGGADPDHLDGGAGDDHLLACTHGGVMVGGPGNDTFEYSGTEGRGRDQARLLRHGRERGRLGRVVHHATVLTTAGDSYRLKAATRNQASRARQEVPAR